MLKMAIVMPCECYLYWWHVRRCIVDHRNQGWVAEGQHLPTNSSSFWQYLLISDQSTGADDNETDNEITNIMEKRAAKVLVFNESTNIYRENSPEVLEQMLMSHWHNKSTNMHQENSPNVRQLPVDAVDNDMIKNEEYQYFKV